jgi:hypothetical protein
VDRTPSRLLCGKGIDEFRAPLKSSSRESHSGTHLRNASKVMEALALQRQVGTAIARWHPINLDLTTQVPLHEVL